MVLEVGWRKLTRPRGSAPLVLTTWFGGDKVTNRQPIIDYIELSFVMAEVGNLHAKLGGSHGLHTWFMWFTWFTPLGPLIR
jgi:hypothetical protein